MRNSTIAQKWGQCVDCPKDSKHRPLIAGRCQIHYKIHRNRQNNASKKRMEPGKPVYSLKKELDAWFVQREREMSGVCANCGGPTSKGDKKYARYCIAHVLPKRESMFPSVATHPDNWVELCYFNNSCHAAYDHSWEKAASMPVFALAKEKFRLFKDLISENERRKIPEIFLLDSLK